MSDKAEITRLTAENERLKRLSKFEQNLVGIVVDEYNRVLEALARIENEGDGSHAVALARAALFPTQEALDAADIIAARVKELEGMLDEVYIFLGGVDDASEIRQRIMALIDRAALSPAQPTPMEKT
jgi:hypothetical protein